MSLKIGPGRTTPRPAERGGNANGVAEQGRLTHRKSSSESSFRSVLARSAKSIASGEKVIEKALRAAKRGQSLSPEQLIGMQAGVFRYTQEVELASRLAEKVTNSVKQTLQSQT